LDSEGESGCLALHRPPKPSSPPLWGVPPGGRCFLRGDVMQRILIPLFTFFWWKRLHRKHLYLPGKKVRDHVVKVRGWRTALIDMQGRGRASVTFCLTR